MESSESPDDGQDSELTEEDRKYLGFRNAFAKKHAKKYGLMAETQGGSE